MTSLRFTEWSMGEGVLYNLVFTEYVTASHRLTIKAALSLICFTYWGIIFTLRRIPDVHHAAHACHCIVRLNCLLSESWWHTYFKLRSHIYIYTNTNICYLMWVLTYTRTILEIPWVDTFERNGKKQLQPCCQREEEGTICLILKFTK